MKRRALALANLGYHFARQLLWTLPLRLFRRGRDADRFLRTTRAEALKPLTPAERAAFPALMNCIHCGLCTLACPALREAPAGVAAEPWSFVAGASRALDLAAAAVPDLMPCTRCDACAAVCPTGIPIPRLNAMIERLGTAAPIERNLVMDRARVVGIEI